MVQLTSWLQVRLGRTMLAIWCEEAILNSQPLFSRWSNSKTDNLCWKQEDANPLSTGFRRPRKVFDSFKRAVNWLQDLKGLARLRSGKFECGSKNVFGKSGIRLKQGSDDRDSAFQTIKHWRFRWGKIVKK